MKITIETIPHKEQRYETCGDWTFDKDGNLNMFISDMKNWKYEALVAVHELVEVLLCKDRKISQKTVDAFDINFEKERAKGLHDEEDEPGDDPKSPYRKEHQFATDLEFLLAHQLNVDTEKYADKIYSL